MDLGPPFKTYERRKMDQLTEEKGVDPESQGRKVLNTLCDNEEWKKMIGCIEMNGD